MALKLAEKNSGKVLEVEVIGELTHADYQSCIGEFERLLHQHGKLRVLYDLVNFHGWEATALWDEIRFDVKHFSNIERMAIIGDKKWENWMAEFTKPFTGAQVRFFDSDQLEFARAWVSGD
jgi:SpoIIAA-like